MVQVFDVHRHFDHPPADEALFRVPPRAEHVEFAEGVAAMSGPRRLDEVFVAVHPPSYYVLTEGIEATRRLNDLAHSVAEVHGAGVVPVGTVEPHHGEAALAEIDRVALELGLTALGWRPRAQGVFADAPTMTSLVARAADRGLVPMVHASAGSGNEALWRVWRLAERFPSVPIVVLGALSDWDQKQEVLAQPDRASNVVYDLTGFFGEAEDIEGVAARLGAERLVFGSGAGCDLLVDGDRAARVVADSALAEPLKRAVLWDNAARLFGLEGAPT